MAGAFCIFCGQKPETKTKEHIFPQWLLKLTGADGTKPGTFPRSFLKDGLESLRLPATRFTLPACDLCNNKYSPLEDKVSVIMRKLISQEPLRAEDYHLLLDWFDKLRRVLWSAIYILGKNEAGIEPTKFVNNLIGVEDRALIICRTTTPDKVLISDGASADFSFAPISFVIVINGLVFLSTSFPGLCSRNLGFPFSLEFAETSDRRGRFTQPISGTAIVRNPVHPYFDQVRGLEIYQASFKRYLQHSRLKPYTETQYVRTHSFADGSGLSLPYLHLGDRGDWANVGVDSTWDLEALPVSSVLPKLHELNYFLRLQSLKRSVCLVPQNKRAEIQDIVRKLQQFTRHTQWDRPT